MENTRRHIITGYVLFSLFFLAGIFGYGLFRINSISIEKSANIDKKLQRFKTTLEAEFAQNGTLNYIRMDKIFDEYLEDKDAQILVLVVYTQDQTKTSILKTKGKSKEYLGNARIGNWDARPQYNTPFGTKVYELPVTLGYKTATLPSRIGAVYVNFSVQNLHSLMWEIFYIFLAYFALTFLTIIVLGLVFKQAGADLAGKLKIETTPAVQTNYEQFHDSYEDDFSFPDLGPAPDFDYKDEQDMSEPFPGPGEFNDEFTEPDIPDTVSVSSAEVSGTTLYNKKTGFVKAIYFKERLEAELERAASFDQDLSLVFISLGSVQLRENQLMEFSSLIHNYFTFHDLSFEYKNDIIACVAPDEDIDAAAKISAELKNASENKGYNIAIGIASRNGRILSSDIFIDEAAAALKHAKNAGGDNIVAFRIDPEKYRNALS